MSSNNMADPRRQNKILRYKPPSTETNPTLEDPTPDYMNLLGMIFSMCGLMLKVTYGSAHTRTHRHTPAHAEPLVLYPLNSGPWSSPAAPFRRLKLKWCAWIAVYCSFISFANSRSSEDTKQMMSSFMLSISAVVMSYLQNPQPMSPPW
ncbi:hypothetical protein INR49_003375 [Caranx melampygus]|nr:hypothetical protein INR49_003375 [Caranx melampygus]